jgi:hypothetical protein
MMMILLKIMMIMMIFLKEKTLKINLIIRLWMFLINLNKNKII